METTPMAGKTWQPSHAPKKIGTGLTDPQWKAKGGEGREQKPLKRSTHDAPTFHHTDK